MPAGMLPARGNPRNAATREARPPSCFPTLHVACGPRLATHLKRGVDCGIYL